MHASSPPKTKEGQETILAVEIICEGLEWALAHARLTHYERGLHPDRATWKRELKGAAARAQWDPERDLRLQPLPYRSPQLGLADEPYGSIGLPAVIAEGTK